MLKVNVSILNKKPGDIVVEGDRDYDTFLSWAERKDRKGGMVICEPVSGNVETAEGDAASGMADQGDLDNSGESEVEVDEGAEGEQAAEQVEAEGQPEEEKPAEGEAAPVDEKLAEAPAKEKVSKPGNKKK